MTKSFWRASHLILALVSCVFLVITSVTGFILSFEPIYDTSQSSRVKETDTLSIAFVLENVTMNYNEIQSISRNPQGAIQLAAFHNNKNQKFFISPYSGKKNGDIYKTPKIFEFNRNLHRSLFLKKTGRFLIGICSVLLIISSLTGILLIIKKQGSIVRFFRKIVKNEFNKDTHTKLGRAFLFPILIISISGTYLFMERFSLITEFKVRHKIDYELLKDSPQVKLSSFPVLNEHKTRELKELIFPFSTDIEDYYELKLQDREILFNQRNGEIISEIIYPTSKTLSLLSFTLHTGETSVWWAIVLGLSSLSILYFNYSGFMIYLKDKNPKTSNPFKMEECPIVMLVGSEQGNTFRFATALQKALITAGKKAFITEMNDISTYDQLSHLLILTSTYGNGEAPSNALKFLNKISKTPINKETFNYAVLGFGSKSYPNFCQFAFDVDKKFTSFKNTNQLLNIHTVNDNHFASFKQWVEKLEIKLNCKLNISESDVVKKKIKTTSFTVINKVYSQNKEDATFLLELGHPPSYLFKYSSGDLIGIFPEENQNERFYSVGFNEKKQSLLLSIKVHENGVCSNFLNELNPKDQVSAYLKSNENFHAPKKAQKVIMIANGTGIAPFLGMITNNLNNQEFYLFWGGQNETSYQLYKPYLEKGIQDNKLKKISLAYSRNNGNKEYVQDILLKEKDMVNHLIKENCTIMICGSLAMKDEVFKSLDIICQEELGLPIHQLVENGLVKTDCY